MLGLSGKPEKLIDVARCLGDHSDFSSGAEVVRVFGALSFRGLQLVDYSEEC